MLAFACAAALGSLHAQTPAAPADPAPAPGVDSSKDDPAAAGRRNQKIENIHIEDSGAKIDEQRYGGQTQSITVTPKNNMPSYEVLPNSSGPNADGKGQSGAGGTGPAVWNVLKF